MSGTPGPERSVSARLETVLAGCVERLGLDLEEVELTPAGKKRVLRVAVDSDDGVTLDDIADLTRAVSAELDATDVMGAQPYTLEVSSRGTDRPLLLPRHWRRNRGRLVRATLAGGEVVQGRIQDPREDAAHVATGGDVRVVHYDDVQTAHIEVELADRGGR